MNSEAKSSPADAAQSQEKNQQNTRKYTPPHRREKRGNNNNNNQRQPNSQNRGSKSYNNQNRKFNNRSSKNRFVDVYTSDFQAMHERCVKMGMNLPIKYKVHIPKAPTLKHKLSSSGTLRYIEDPNHKGGSIPLPLDGMIVRPDMKSLQFFFLGKHTSLSEFSKNPRETERRLQEQIDASFQASTVTSTSTTDGNDDDEVEQVTRAMAALSTTTSDPTNLPTSDPTIMKFACAADLLDEEPNGFACVTSSSEQVVATVRDWTRQQASQVSQKATDHGDFAVSLPRALLWEFLQALQAEKKKQKTAQNSRPLPQVRDEILSRMTQQGVDAASNGTTTTKIKFGHHLESLLYLMMQNPSKNTIPYKQNKKTKNNDETPPTTIGEDFMLIYGHDDTEEEAEETKLELNVPGGKRTLGETSLQAAIRETEEEISLRWKESWITKIYQNKKDPSLKMNRFFILHPPDLEALKV